MKNIILIFLLGTISFALSGQDSISNNYKRQIGFDIKPVINTFSGVSSFPLLSEYEILYTQVFFSKYSVTAKLSYFPNDFQSLKTRAFVPFDSTFILNRLESSSSARLHFNLSKKIVKKRINLYWGITTGINFNQGFVHTIEFDTIGTFDRPNVILNETFNQSNFRQFVIGPHFGAELPINSRWQILVNFNFTATMEFGTWEYLNKEREIVTGDVYSRFNYDFRLLRDIGIMYSF